MELSHAVVNTPSDARVKEARAAVKSGIAFLQRKANPMRKSAIGFLHLGKLRPITAEHLDDLRVCFAPLLNQPWMEFRRQLSSRSLTVLGLSESGIVPSYIVSSLLGLETQWFCTTRRRQADLATFQEAHSHAPTHFLPKDFCEHPPSELWIVEDEITTGKTLLNLLRCLPEAFSETSVRIFSLLDARQVDARAEFELMASCLVNEGRLRSLCCESVFDWAEVEALQWKSDPTVPGAFGDTKLSSKIPRLVVGEAIREALAWLDRNPSQRLQHVSLSPWSVDGVYVRSCYQVGEHFLYNWAGALPPHSQLWLEPPLRS